jgi:predicted lipid-binding transport protein (Tim44 family)
VLVAAGLGLGADQAAAATFRHAAATIGGLALVTGILVVREWPVGFAGWVGVAGTLLAAALWFWKARYRTEWFSSTPTARTLAPAASVRRAAAGMALQAAPPRSRPDEPAAVLQAARRCFVDLQAAWDLADIEGLRSRTTPEMLAELVAELPTRGAGPNRTDVVTLHAELLSVERVGTRYLASVEFSGMIRESADAGAAPFKEVWMLTADADGVADWRLARHLALL